MDVLCEWNPPGLPNPKSVKDMFDGGDGGLLSGFSPGKIWVDHSTTDFGQTFEFEKGPLTQNVRKMFGSFYPLPCSIVTLQATYRCYYLLFRHPQEWMVS